MNTANSPLRPASVCIRRWTALLVCAGLSLAAHSQSDMAIYTDSLQNGWDNWSWSTTLNFSSSGTVHGGSAAISANITAAWGALSLHHSDINTSSYSDLRFWIHGGTAGGQRLRIYAELGSTAQPSVDLPTLSAGAWQQITLSLSSLGVANQPNFARFSIQDRSGSGAVTFYVDDITLVANVNPGATVTLTSPANNSSYAAPATIPFAATVAANGHTINRVEFYNGTTLLNEDTSAPYSYSWNNVSAGTYAVKARVIYDGTASADSSTANVTVTGVIPVTIAIDTQLNRHPINPLIYGVAFASATEMSDLNAPLNRSGGNSETRYNWQLNAHNHANDWYYESLGKDPATPAAATDSHITASKNGGGQPMLTIPMIEWMPKLGPSRGKLASYSIAKYGAQTGNDWEWMPDAGNGVRTDGSLIVTNDPNDANFKTNVAFQNAFVRYLTNKWGVSTNGGVRYYCLDNEHSIWHSTHRDVHPVGATMEEIRDKMIAYGSMVKSNDPNALLVGPEEFGWSGYYYSGYDLWYCGKNGWSYIPNRATNGGWDYVPWLLNQIRQHDLATGKRLLDCFSLHIYPQSGEFAEDASTDMQTMRNRSTRQLWDPSYTDPSWINDEVMLIPRMKSWVNAYYPGTMTGITEYNWGAENHINGATTQADILGIFGRESLDIATRWTTPPSSSPTYKAIKMYRNYDGSKSTFGDTSVSASVPNPDNVSAFAAVRSADGTLTVMIINKQLIAGAAVTVNLANFVPADTAEVWQLTAANSINHLNDLPVSGSSFAITVPAQSITHLVIPAGAETPPGPPLLTSATITSPGTFAFTLNGEAGKKYLVEYSPDLIAWSPISTNTLSTTTSNLVYSVPVSARFFRARWGTDY